MLSSRGQKQQHLPPAGPRPKEHRLTAAGLSGDCSHTALWAAEHLWAPQGTPAEGLQRSSVAFLSKIAICSVNRTAAWCAIAYTSSQDVGFPTERGFSSPLFTLWATLFSQPPHSTWFKFLMENLFRLFVSPKSRETEYQKISASPDLSL